MSVTLGENRATSGRNLSKYKHNAAHTHMASRPAAGEWFQQGAEPGLFGVCYERHIWETAL